MKRVNIVLIKIVKRIFSILKKILWKCIYLKDFKCGRGTHFYPRCHVVLDGNGSVLIGEYCFFNNNCSINSMDKIEIGNNCIFGENVCLYDHNHEYRLSKELIRKQGYSVNKIKIGNNCWIGSNVIILSGIEIGNNVVIAAGTTVTKNIEDNSIVIDKNNLLVQSYLVDNNKNTKIGE